MLSALRSVWTWLAVTALFLVWLPLLFVVRFFDRDPALYRTGRFFRRLGAVVTRINPAWRIEVSGTMPVDPRAPYVVVCNHLSLADIPVVSRLPWEMKWVAKAELFRLPIVGTMMRIAGDIPVDRGERTSGARALVQARGYLARRCSVIFFPEGTRSRDGRLLPFTDGAFRLAIKSGVPVLPLVIDGTQDALPKHSWKMEGRSHIRLKVLTPIDTVGLGVADTEALRERVRCQIREELAAWRGVVPGAVDTLPVRAPVDVEDSVKAQT